MSSAYLQAARQFEVRTSYSANFDFFSAPSVLIPVLGVRVAARVRLVTLLSGSLPASSVSFAILAACCRVRSGLLPGLTLFRRDARQVFNGMDGSTTQLLEVSVGIAQHHDGVSGTSKQHVAFDCESLCFSRTFRLGRCADRVSCCVVCFLPHRCQAVRRKLPPSWHRFRLSH